MDKILCVSPAGLSHLNVTGSFTTGNKICFPNLFVKRSSSRVCLWDCYRRFANWRWFLSSRRFSPPHQLALSGALYSRCRAVQASKIKQSNYTDSTISYPVRAMPTAYVSFETAWLLWYQEGRRKNRAFFLMTMKLYFPSPHSWTLDGTLKHNITLHVYTGCK